MERKMRAAYWREYFDSLKPDYEMRKSMIGARLRAGFSQRELARRMMVSQSAIARIERGATSPNVRTLRKVAEATGSKLVIRLEGPELPGTTSLG
jgi:transcriptional regulator with XRE-family HTH domain